MTIKYNSATHDLLSVAKVLDRPFIAEEAMKVMVSLSKESRVRESADILVKHGLLRHINEGYEITDDGRQHLYRMVAAHSKKSAT